MPLHPALKYLLLSFGFGLGLVAGVAGFYMLKSAWGLNLISRSGYHASVQCLNQQLSQLGQPPVVTQPNSGKCSCRMVTAPSGITTISLTLIPKVASPTQP